MSLSESIQGPYDATLTLFAESAHVLSNAWMHRRAAGRRAEAESSQALSTANEGTPDNSQVHVKDTARPWELCVGNTRSPLCDECSSSYARPAVCSTHRSLGDMTMQPTIGSALRFAQLTGPYTVTFAPSHIDQADCRLCGALSEAVCQRRLAS